MLLLFFVLFLIKQYKKLPVPVRAMCTLAFYSRLVVTILLNIVECHKRGTRNPSFLPIMHREATEHVTTCIQRWTYRMGCVKPSPMTYDNHQQQQHCLSHHILSNLTTAVLLHHCVEKSASKLQLL